MHMLLTQNHCECAHFSFKRNYNFIRAFNIILVMMEKMNLDLARVDRVLMRVIKISC